MPRKLSQITRKTSIQAKQKNWAKRFLSENDLLEQFVLKPSRFFWRAGTIRNNEPDRFVQLSDRISKENGVEPTVRRSLLLVV